MRQLIITAPGRTDWREVPMPVPGPGEVLVRVAGVSTCPHWDLHILGGEPMFPGHGLEYPYAPGKPGHEAVGEVVARGESVDDFAVGQAVAAWVDGGPDAAGFYAQFTVFPAKKLIAVPAGRPPAEFASLELAMCVEVSFQQLAPFGGVRGKRVGVAGLGPAGLVAVQLARFHGAAAVVGIDRVAERRDTALALGAIEAMDSDPQAWPAGRSGPQALDVAIDCTGVTPAVEFLLHRTRVAVALFGVVRGQIAYAGELMWGPGVSLVGYGDHNRAAAETALEAIVAGALRLETLISATLPLRHYVEGVAMLREQRAIKVLFDPWL